MGESIRSRISGSCKTILRSSSLIDSTYFLLFIICKIIVGSSDFLSLAAALVQFRLLHLVTVLVATFFLVTFILHHECSNSTLTNLKPLKLILLFLILTIILVGM